MKLRTLFMAGALMLTLAGVVAAQTVAPTPTPAPVATTTLADASSDITVSGKVVSSTSTELVIDSDAGQRMSFALDPNTIPTATFTVGERVTVKYHSMSGGTVFQAANIVVEPQTEVEPQDVEVVTPDSPQLPETASELPLIGLLGLLAMGGAVVTRVALS
jgi:hypothetical protein